MSETIDTQSDVLSDAERYELDPKQLSGILEAVEGGDSDQLRALLDPMHPADIADVLEQVNAHDRRRIVELYDKELDGEILTELDDEIQEEVIRYMRPSVLADAVRELESDEVVDLVEDLDEPEQEAILDALEDADRAVVEQSLSYPEDSAGRLMQRETAWAPEHWNVGQCIDYLRGEDDLPEQFYHVILVDPRMKPVGNVTLGRIMSAKREVLLKDLSEETFHIFPVNEDEEDVAYAFNQYHLISAPVVDENERLVGVITIDDAMIVLDEELEEDILRMAGVSEDSLNSRVFATTLRRLPWLGINMITAILAASVIAQFEATIEKIVALAVLMPVVASMGGNAGTQSLTIAVRALATKDLTSANVWRVIRREMLVGLTNGLTLAAIVGCISFIWFGSADLGYVIAIAIVINLGVAGLAGTVIPVVLDKLDIDPALASGTFLTTVTDVVGFFVFLGLASLVLV